MLQQNLKKLKNGLCLVTAPMPGIESVTAMVGVGVGSRYETKRTNGLSHMLEHMAFKGTKRRPSSEIISSEIDSVGGMFNAFTEKELTAFYIKVPSKYIKVAFDILSDMIGHSLLKAEEIEKEKGVVIEEINMYEDAPMQRVMEIYVRLLYGDNPMGWDEAGEKGTVGGLKRADFLDYINRFYYPENMVLALAGKFDEATAEKLTADFFLPMEKRGKKETAKIGLGQSKPKTKVVYKKTEQAHFCLGTPGYDLFNPKRYTLAVLTTVLGGGMSSRLFSEIREKRGLAYYVSAETEFYTDSGFLLGRAGVRLNQAEEAIKVMKEEMFKLTEKKVPEKELQKAKETLKGHLVLSLEDSKNVAGRVVTDQLLEGRIRSIEEVLRAVDRVTAADCQAIAREVFTQNNLNLALIGPFREIAPFEKLLR